MGSQNPPPQAGLMGKSLPAIPETELVRLTHTISLQLPLLKSLQDSPKKKKKKPSGQSRDPAGFPLTVSMCIPGWISEWSIGDIRLEKRKLPFSSKEALQGPKCSVA